MEKLSEKQVERKAKKTILENHIEKKCEICGSKDKLHIHHIDKNRQNNSIDNLKILCNSHHQKFFHIRPRCPVCKSFLGKNHNCKRNWKKMGEKHKILMKNYPRCLKCGKLLGDVGLFHSCEHPRGMLGKYHTEETKRKIRIKTKQKLRELKKQGIKLGRKTYGRTKQ